jgi:hypothetical protein
MSYAAIFSRDPAGGSAAVKSGSPPLYASHLVA